MPRLTDSWIDEFLDWTLDRSEAPAEFIQWSGLFALSSVTKRHVRWPPSLMGSYSIYPNLYVLFVGPPGVVRKTTTSNYAEELLTELQHVNTASSSGSVSKFVEIMSNTIDGSISIISGEFSSFIATGKEEMYDLLTDLYDGKSKFDYATRSHEIEVIKQPCVNMLACTTPEWISGQPPHVIGGGFASRTVFIYAEERRAFHLYYPDINWLEVERTKEVLLKDLEHIGSLEGNFRHDNKETFDWISEWYERIARKGTKEKKLEGFINRKHLHVHKVASLLSVSERDDLIVTREHFERAIKWVEEAERNMPRVLQNVGKNPFAKEYDDIRHFIHKHGQATRGEVIRSFYSSIPPEQIEMILKTLSNIGEIESDGDGGWKALS